MNHEAGGFVNRAVSTHRVWRNFIELNEITDRITVEKLECSDRTIFIEQN